MDRAAWDDRYRSTDLLWTAEPNRFLVEHVVDLPPGRALDVACGEGRNAVWLAERGWDVTGVDFSGVALEKARRLAEARGVDVAWIEADVVDEPLTTEGYELVVVMYLHLPEPARRRAFASAAAAVAPGGTLLLVGHDRSNPVAGYGGPQNEAVLYGPDDVLADIGDLDVVEAREVERPVTTDDGPRVAIDCLVLARRPLT